MGYSVLQENLFGFVREGTGAGAFRWPKSTLTIPDLYTVQFLTKTYHYNLPYEIKKTARGIQRIVVGAMIIADANCQSMIVTVNSTN